MTALLLLFAIAVFLILYFIINIYEDFKYRHTYWDRKGIKGPTPEHFYGNLKPLMRKEHGLHTLTDDIYQQYPKEKVVGIYQGYMPTLIIRDPQIMKDVLIKDFPAFVNRGVRINNEPIEKHLFAADGDYWKTLRQKLTPIFTTGKLKNMMPLLNKCVNEYMRYLDTIVTQDGYRDVAKLNMKYTMKSITTIAFGIDVDTFVEDKTEFELMANKLLIPSGTRRFSLLLYNIWPGIVDKLPITIAAELTKFFMDLVTNIISEREGQPKVRKDFMDLMIELKEQGKVTRVKDGGIAELDITDELIAAQALVFYIAGFEASSGVMSFLLYELAKQPQIQDRCYEEIRKVMEKHSGILDYDALKELEYLSQAFDEALRIYPIASLISRQAVTDYTFRELNLTIKKGTKILIPLLSLHMEPNYFSNPEKFDPERFAPGYREYLHDYYLPFGDGPRNCIGLRYARVQSLLGMAHFLQKFQVSTYEKTPEKIRFDPTRVTLTSKDGLWLHIEKRGQ